MAAGWPAKVNYATGDVLSASNMNDIGGTLNLINPYTAGKNAIINGAFNVWQRGTSFSGVSGYAIYNAADRFNISSTGGSSTVSQQAFTYGTAPVAGYESQYFMRLATAASAMTYFDIAQKIEDVRTFAGQTITMSFWVKSNVATTLVPQIIQQFGTGGSTQVTTNGTTFATTTSWTRYSATIAVPSIAGKTIGAGSSTSAFLAYSSGTINSVTLDTWGWQVELGSTATPFQTASGTVGGELALCQRYYFRNSGDTFSQMGTGVNSGTTTALINVPAPVTMRVVPTVIDYSSLAVYDSATYPAVTAIAFTANQSSFSKFGITCTVASGLTQYRPVILIGNNSASCYLGFSAEL